MLPLPWLATISYRVLIFNYEPVTRKLSKTLAIIEPNAQKNSNTFSEPIQNGKTKKSLLTIFSH
jgi:hypothetical protein